MQIGREKEYRQKKKHAKRGEKQTGLKKKIYQDFITNNFCWTLKWKLIVQEQKVVSEIL